MPNPGQTWGVRCPPHSAQLGATELHQTWTHCPQHIFLGSGNKAASLAQHPALNIHTQTSLFPFHCNLPVPLCVLKAVSYKSLHRTSIIPVSLCHCPFQTCKKYYVTYNPACSQIGTTDLVTKAQDSRVGAALAQVPELQLLPTINLPTLSCWNLLVCWLSGCRKMCGLGDILLQNEMGHWVL